MDKKKHYTNDDIHNAIQSIKGGMSISKASKTFNIPRQTLSDKYNGKTAIVCKPGVPTILSAEEEKILVNWVLDMARQGFPITKTQLCDSVQILMSGLKRPNPFPDNRPQRHWYESFLKRHPTISERVTQNLSKQRSKVTKDQILCWFQEIKTFLTDNDYLAVFDDPRRIYNCDETAFFLSPKGDKVLARKGDKTVYSFITNDEKECLTALLMCNAVGDLPPPLVMYPFKRIPKAITTNFPNSWAIGRSDKGWMTQESFFEYIANMFYPWLQTNNIKLPVVLFVDGHSSHITLQLSKFCSDKGIILICLFPNSTHILQPLDVAVFHTLKSTWKKIIQNWRIEHKSEKLGKEHFAQLLKVALEELTTLPKTIENGFKICGLCPFCPENIKFDKFFKYEKPIDSQEHDKDSTHLDDRAKFIEYFEKVNYRKMDLFKTSGPIWNGAIEDTSLFYFWRNLKDCNVEILTNVESESPNSVSNNSPILISVNPNNVAVTETISDVILFDDKFFRRKKDGCLPFLDIQISEEDLNASVDDIDTSFLLNEINCSNNDVQQLDPQIESQQKESNMEHSSKNVRNIGNLEQAVKVIEVTSNINKNDQIELLESVSNREIAYGNKNSTNNLKSIGVTNNMDKVNQLKLLERVSNPEMSYEIRTVDSPGKENTKKHDIENLPSINEYPEINKIAALTDHNINQETNVVYKTPQKLMTQRPKIPTPFKKYLFWDPPKTEKKEPKRKPKEKVPAVVSSPAWQEYQQKKEDKKLKEITEKEQGKQQRIKKQMLKIETNTQKKTRNDYTTKKLAPKKAINIEKNEKTSKIQNNIESVDNHDISLDSNSDRNSSKSEVDITRLCERDYVVVQYEKKLYPGLIIKVDRLKKECTIKCMVKSGAFWKWPERDDVLTYLEKDIICSIRKPKLANSRGLYHIPDFPKDTYFST